MNGLGSLEGKAIVVTGAAQGIGAALVDRSISLGARVVAVDRNADGLAELEKRHGKAVLAQTGDVADAGFVLSAVSRAIDHFGAIHGLANNAGITRPAMIEKMALEQWNQVLEVHLTAAFLWTQAVGKHMIQRFKDGDSRPGAIVNHSSIAGLRGSIGQINYAAAKSGQLGMSLAIAREWARYGIRANSVCFGVVETPMTETIRGDKFRDGMLAGIPLGRWAQPEEVTPMICFLLSDDASFITGQFIAIDGGVHSSL
ncbi:MAG: SDR family oxidoreductase [Gemmatimonadales bacterium]|nr:SDR family oxidoreductase [Gemmatimonadales bacterium]